MRPNVYKERYYESTEPIDAVNILPIARFLPTTLTTPPSTTLDIDATNCATETSPKKDVQEALILTLTNAVHVVDWFYLPIFIYCVNLNQFLILCSSKEMMFVKLYFCTSDIYLISLVSLDPSGFHLRTK